MNKVLKYRFSLIAFVPSEKRRKSASFTAHFNVHTERKF